VVWARAERGANVAAASIARAAAADVVRKPRREILPRPVGSQARHGQCPDGRGPAVWIADIVLLLRLVGFAPDRLGRAHQLVPEHVFGSTHNGADRFRLVGGLWGESRPLRNTGRRKE
jgi:hypothetical protein